MKPTALHIFATPGGRAWLALFKDEINPKLARTLNDLVENKPLSGMPSRADWQAAPVNMEQS